MSDRQASRKKSILKDPLEIQAKKSFKWDEMNILATYHPTDKTYGHMKIDEPKTPFVYDSADGCAMESGTSFTPEELAARLEVASTGSEKPRVAPTSFEDCINERKNKEFQEKRKLHYNEFYASKLAKDHLYHNSDDDMSGEDDDDGDDDDELKRLSEEAKRNARLNVNLFHSSKYTGSDNNKGGSHSK